MEEIWKDIEGYEGLYQVSNLGKVRNSKKEILKNGLKNGRYNYISLHKDKVIKQKYIHRLVAQAFIINKDTKLNNVVNHIDCNKSNNSVKNLEWCTQKHNIIESIKNRLQSRAYETKLVNKLTGDTKKFRSMLSASIFLGKKYNVIDAKSDYLKSNKFEIDNYLIYIKEVMPTCHV